MNSVSWFIYVAQVSDSLGTTLCALGVIGLIACGAAFIIGTIIGSVDAEDFRPFRLKIRYVAMVLVLLIVGNLLPEKKTMYAIAASQVGERLSQNEAVQGAAGDAAKALQAWIKKQIDPEPKK